MILPLLQTVFVQGKGRCEKQSQRTVKTALGVLVISLSGAFGVGSLPGWASQTTQFNLDNALCNNNWSDAITIISTLVGNDRTTQRDRSALLDLRSRLVQYRAKNRVVPQLEACDRIAPYQLDARSTSNAERAVQPVLAQAPTLSQFTGWEAAIRAAAHSELSTHITTESVPFALPVEVDEIAGLTPASPVDLQRGLNVVAGQVGTGHDVYSFVAGLGDSINADLDVTRVMTGTLYTSDDSQLFIFNSEGKLLATADDTRGKESRISNFVAPKTDVYFAVVTSYNNDPILTRDDYLSGWQDNGGGRFEYTLTLSGATRTSALLRE